MYTNATVESSQNKAKLRAILRSSLANKRAADEVLNAIMELQSQMNALLAKLDVDTGVASTNYAATLSVHPITE